ncbi:MAG TPA: glycoside hydrolase family 2 TIM barrel-domain containing protein, partial [Polyangiaceae bacterium]|nr:glycoside hydrolase family 2 TIM barrel-domain containing protein [Polyangiaceae bacterium]
KIQVPGGGWLKQGINATSGTYSTTITVPDSGGPQTTLLEFGAVDNEATLSVDGMTVGTQTTTLTPQVYDVSKFVKPGSQHQISVAVKSFKALMSNGKYLVPHPAPWSNNVALGILRSVTIRAVPSVYISDVFVRTSVANDSLTYDVSLTNTGATDQQISLSGALSSWNCDANTYPAIPSSMVTVPAGMTHVTTVGPIGWGLGPTSFWWPNVPYAPGYKAKLHNLKVDLSVGGQVQHEDVVRFGFREIQMKRADAMHVYYYLNGVHVRLRGDNLQGADYDSIINAGQGDAYDTLPGFLPPSGQNTGWPGAVGNYQKLNYNFVRVHQELASPYMLDTADELGLMLMGETSIRGSNSNENFSAGHDNMVNHAKAMVLRDRNHPAIIRWSQSNEPDLESEDSDQFEGDLYTAINTLDPTRPVSVDGPTNRAYGIAAYGTNFATFGHYNNGLGNYSEQVNASPNQPFGQGEFIWPADATSRGLMWFATSCAAMRRQDASDIRPYALLSGFASIIPGVTRMGMAIESSSDPRTGQHPLFGEDNLPDPWSNPIVQRIQNAYSPMLVLDQAYWEANKMSDDNGDWPVSAAVPTLTKGSMSSRTLLIFNDTFSGASLDVTWEVHADSPTGAIASMGTLSSVMVPLGTMTTQTINITAPSSGTKAYLVLRSRKSGTQTAIFEEDGQYFTLN